ncbi:hypothetical protein AXG93_1027s1080 [Marchantia polymorpha subsp. ruderalis]|uniref:Uncharacterized protein n=1 Tax=Marchantia polymorpha subsp. ruderalis TaxID=1480154 RepID=A0A176W1P0_MARPO|nr:hypothetical protein AXG93_1027s1080 [Marchantia polymorpha subsp. ruderalis]
MASDHEWFDTWIHQSSTPPRRMKVQTSEDELDAKHQNLSMLLNVFFGIFLPSIGEIPIMRLSFLLMRATSACQLRITFGGSSACTGGNGGKLLSNSFALGCVGGTSAGNGSSNGTRNILFEGKSSLLPGQKGFNVGKKVSVISGTLSCHKQHRKNGFSHFDAGKNNKENREGDEFEEEEESDLDEVQEESDGEDDGQETHENKDMQMGGYLGEEF